jgi:hypothetical protein
MEQRQDHRQVVEKSVLLYTDVAKRMGRRGSASDLTPLNVID